MAGGDGGDGAERGEAGLVVGEGGGVEVVVAVGGEEGAVDVALLEAGEDGLQVGREGVGGGLGGVGGVGAELAEEKQWRDLLGDVGGGVGGFLVGEDRDGDVVVGEDDVFGDEAADFAGVLDDLAAVEVEDLDAEAVVGVLAVWRG